MTMLLLILLILWPGASICAPDAQAAAPADTRWVEFTYPDNDYKAVCIVGTFTAWQQVPLKREDSQWLLRLRVPASRAYYRFSVLEQDDRWNAIDPNNPTAINHEEYGWVSVLKAGRRLSPAGRGQERKKECRQRDCRIRRELKRDQGITSIVSYQRVDGLVLNIADSHMGKEPFAPALRWHVNYGFSSGRFGGGLCLLQPLGLAPLSLKIAIFDRTMPNNRFSGIGTMENTLAGFFLHEDYFDYHRAKGGRASLVLGQGDWLRLETGVRSVEQTRLGRRSVWSWKGGEFIPNPAIDEGTLRSLFGQIRVGRRFNHIKILYERSGGGLFGGDFNFERVWAQARGRLDLGQSQVARLDARVAAGRNLKGRLPLQERFLLGGRGTVRGYGYQSLLLPATDAPGQPFGGEMSLLANVEYSFKAGAGLGLALFYDTGMVWQDAHAAGDLGDLKSSTGIGLLRDDDENLRIDLIQRLDGGNHPVSIQMRLRRGF
ncbi:hypothetical protein CSB20_03520 [bacterium DOLZORAL124_64_63]|nr:MAG: hypothetical protein CSB20_03520 [bacterium DOLZORAL124_64_63]